MPTTDEQPAAPTLADLDRRLLDQMQADFPIAERPWDTLAARAAAQGAGDLDGDGVLQRVQALKADGIIRQIGPIFDTRALGYSSNLVAARVAPEKLNSAAAVVSAHPGVSHNYERQAEYNLWFTLAVPPGEKLDDHLEALSKAAGFEACLPLPATRTFHIGVKLDMSGAGASNDSAATKTTKGPAERRHLPRAARRDAGAVHLTDFDKHVIRITQDDLPLVADPFAVTCADLAINFTELAAWFERMREVGVLRRFAAILRHRQAGFSANGMGVWVVPEDKIEQAGRIAGQFAPVSHCYQRPTSADWPYNLYTMIHARTPEECQRHVAELAGRLAPLGVTGHRVLYSTREFKKQRVRYFENAAPNEPECRDD